MKRLFLLLLPIALLAYWSFQSLHDPVPPAADQAPERPREEDMAVPGIKPGGGPSPVADASTRSTRPLDGSSSVWCRTVVGTVTDASDGLPIPGAIVRRLHVAASPVVTDGQGRYETEVTEREPVLRVEKDGYPPLTGGVDAGSATRDFQLTRGATVTGRVTDPHGRPMAGVRVSEWADRDRFVETSQDGRFLYRGARTGYPTALLARRDDCMPGGSSVLGLEPGEERGGVVLVVTRAGTITGRLVPWRGLPFSPAVVFLPSSRGTSARVRADGTFRLRPVGSNRALVRAEAADGRVAECEVDAIPVGGERGGVLLRFGAVLTAKVLDAGGEPVSRARLRVRVLDGRVPPLVVDVKTTDAEGLLHRALPFSEQWEIEVLWPDGETALPPHRITATEEPQIFRLPATATVAGLVTRGGQAVSHFTVRLRQGRRTWERLGENGRFRASSIPPGDLNVLVLTNDGWAEPRDLSLASGESREDLAFEIHDAPEIICRVVDESGVAVEGATVRLTAGMMGLAPTARTDRDGRVVLKPLGPGRQFLTANCGDRQAAARIDIAARSEKPHEITLRLTEPDRTPR